MRKFLFFSCFALFASCELFMSKEEQTQKLVNDELLAIDWNDVDQYPLFDNCDETAPKQIQRECFENGMLRIAEQALDSLQFEVQNDLNDTVVIEFKVDEHGFITVEQIKDSPEILNEISNFNIQIKSRLKDLTVAPALKRGNPVSLRFKLPIVINTN
ncbi:MULTISPECIES: hypothetical protein [Flavobacteriaceae]|uniref:hypothetical protein n=1 Tax=Flavobacteriaceae TaxID=49546 RepID=UPI001491FEFB|nr:MULTISPECIES: hypothetical protein [Allomuricauda]MDC6367679.1 hypothetical protein [Muricauda sp. AC10]